jgi:hypothetical protein
MRCCRLFLAGSARRSRRARWNHSPRILFGCSVLCRQVLGGRRRDVGTKPRGDGGRNRGGASLSQKRTRPDRASRPLDDTVIRSALRPRRVYRSAKSPAPFSWRAGPRLRHGDGPRGCGARSTARESMRSNRDFGKRDALEAESLGAPRRGIRRNACRRRTTVLRFVDGGRSNSEVIPEHPAEM